LVVLRRREKNQQESDFPNRLLGKVKSDVEKAKKNFRTVPTIRLKMKLPLPHFASRHLLKNLNAEEKGGGKEG